MMQHSQIQPHISKDYFLKCFWVNSMANHLHIQTGSSWEKSTFYRVVLVLLRQFEYAATFFFIFFRPDVSVELTHSVPMEPRRSESFFLDFPSRWKEDKITGCNSCFISWASEDSKNWRVSVVVGHWAHCVKESQVVFVRIIISMPSMWRITT